MSITVFTCEFVLYHCIMLFVFLLLLMETDRNGSLALCLTATDATFGNVQTWKRKSDGQLPVIHLESIVFGKVERVYA